MHKLLVVIFLVLAITGPARAETQVTAETYISEIRTMMAEQEARWSSNSAKVSLQSAFDAGGVGWAQRYVDSWSDWLWIDWSITNGLYSSAERRLYEWRSAVESGRADAAQVEPMLERGMVRLRLLHTQIQIWFEDDLAYNVRMARWLDRANEAACCDGELYNYYSALANKPRSVSASPDYEVIGKIQVFPAVPEGGGVPALPEPDMSGLERRAAEAFAADDAEAIYKYIREAEVLLLLSDNPELTELSRVLSLIRERMGFAADPVGAILSRAEDLPDGPLRDAIFQQAQDALLNRSAHLTEILTNSATSPEEREGMRSTLLANAKRLAQFADDSRLDFSRSSGASRLFAALSAASHMSDAGERGDVSGAELAKILQDASDAFPGTISPVAPFSGPMGAMAAQINDVRRGFKLAAGAMDGVSAAIGGDSEGLERAQTAARGLEDVLSPKRFVENVTRGFVEGVVNNVPFARSLYDWVKK